MAVYPVGQLRIWSRLKMAPSTRERPIEDCKLRLHSGSEATNFCLAVLSGQLWFNVWKISRHSDLKKKKRAWKIPNETCGAEKVWVQVRFELPFSKYSAVSHPSDNLVTSRSSVEAIEGESVRTGGFKFGIGRVQEVHLKLMSFVTSTIHLVLAHIQINSRIKTI